MHTKSHNELIYLGQKLSKFVVGTEGNISQRMSNGFAIKASGKSLEDMDTYSIVECDIDSNPPHGETNKPSIEACIHSWIYKNSDFSFIAHTHPVNVLKIVCTDLVDEFATTRMFPDQVVFNGVASCVVPYETPGIALMNVLEKAANTYITKYKEFPSLFLLRNHGLICCAKSIEKAIIMTEICEKSAEIFLGTETKYGVRFELTDKSIAAVRNHDGEIHRMKE